MGSLVRADARRFVDQRRSACAAATQVLQVNASPTKPLTLARLQDLDLGTITSKPGIWSAATVSISQAGLFSCATANAACTGATRTCTI